MRIICFTQSTEVYYAKEMDVADTRAVNDGDGIFRMFER